jgi:tetratricopeptide (TPR) repeat protein
MNSWELAKDKGKSCLSRHQPVKALKYFERGVKECPVDENRELASLLYYCGIALKKVGALEDALECWNSSSTLDPQSPAAEMIDRYLGLSEPEEKEYFEEWHSFKSIQLSRYFAYKASGHFDTLDEHRRVHEVISGYWQEILESRILDELDRQERIMLFREVRIDFSSFVPMMPCCREGNVIPFRSE